MYFRLFRWNEVFVTNLFVGDYIFYQVGMAVVYVLNHFDSHVSQICLWAIIYFISLSSGYPAYVQTLVLGLSNVNKKGKTQDAFTK